MTQNSLARDNLRSDSMVFVNRASESSPEAARRAVSEVTAPFFTLKVQDATDKRLPEIRKKLESLKKAGVIPVFAEVAKVVLSGELTKAVTLKGIGATKGARAAIACRRRHHHEPVFRAC